MRFHYTLDSEGAIITCARWLKSCPQLLNRFRTYIKSQRFDDSLLAYEIGVKFDVRAAIKLAVINYYCDLELIEVTPIHVYTTVLKYVVDFYKYKQRTADNTFNDRNNTFNYTFSILSQLYQFDERVLCHALDLARQIYIKYNEVVKIESKKSEELYQVWENFGLNCKLIDCYDTETGCLVHFAKTNDYYMLCETPVYDDLTPSERSAFDNFFGNNVSANILINYLDSFKNYRKLFDYQWDGLASVSEVIDILNKHDIKSLEAVRLLRAKADFMSNISYCIAKKVLQSTIKYTPQYLAVNKELFQLYQSKMIYPDAADLLEMLLNESWIKLIFAV